MALEIKQSIKMSQQMVITPQLQQAIKLLQLSRLELNQTIQNELLENPVLEEIEEEEEVEEEKTESEKREDLRIEDKGHDHTSEEVSATEAKGEEFKEPPDFDWENYVDSYNTLSDTDERASPLREPVTFESTVTQTESLNDHLIWQLQMNKLTPEEQKIGELIISNINDDGYFTADPEELAKSNNIDSGKLRLVLAKIQEFDPTGVAARDIKECLFLQIKTIYQNNDLMRKIVENHLPDFEKHDYPLIAKKLGISVFEVEKACKAISNLEPKPGRAYGGEQPNYIIPDVYITRIGNDYVVTLNDDGLPKLQISKMYRQALMKGSEIKGQTKDYIQDRFKAAMWLIKSIYQRQRTIYKVAKSIVKFQKNFFDEGIMQLKPLVLKEVADDIGVHESTVSRVTTNKYVHTSRGIFELKFFFNSGLQQLEGGGVASEAVKAKIKKMIDDEDSKSPISDQDLCDRLKELKIDIARRTIAKYREILNIPATSKRRKR